MTLAELSIIERLIGWLIVAWLAFVIFGGLAVIGWWLGGLFSTQPGGITYTTYEDTTRTAAAETTAPAPAVAEERSGIAGE